MHTHNAKHTQKQAWAPIHLSYLSACTHTKHSNNSLFVHTKHPLAIHRHPWLVHAGACTAGCALRAGSLAHDHATKCTPCCPCTGIPTYTAHLHSLITRTCMNITTVTMFKCGTVMGVCMACCPVREQKCNTHNMGHGGMQTTKTNAYALW